MTRKQAPFCARPHLMRASAQLARTRLLVRTQPQKYIFSFLSIFYLFMFFFLPGSDLAWYAQRVVLEWCAQPQADNCLDSCLSGVHRITSGWIGLRHAKTLLYGICM